MPDTVRTATRRTVVSDKTYIIESRDGTYRFTCPSTWKVTFGAFNPGGRGYDNDATLRFYEAKDKQRACFRNVQSFRDLSCKVEQMVVEESGETKWEVNEQGSFKQTKTNRKKKWVEEDD